MQITVKPDNGNVMFEPLMQLVGQVWKLFLLSCSLRLEKMAYKVGSYHPDCQKAQRDRASIQVRTNFRSTLLVAHMVTNLSKTGEWQEGIIVPPSSFRIRFSPFCRDRRTLKP